MKKHDLVPESYVRHVRLANSKSKILPTVITALSQTVKNKNNLQEVMKNDLLANYIDLCSVQL